MPFIITLSDETTHTFPSKKVVCPDCDGHGTVLNPSMRGHAYTQEEFSDFSDEEQDAYFNRGGMYDVTCPTCGGKNVVDEPDESRFTEEDKEVFACWQKQQKEEEWYDALCRSEIENGA